VKFTTYDMDTECYSSRNQCRNLADKDKGGWCCTRPKGHKGDHIAHAEAVPVKGRAYRRWPNADSPDVFGLAEGRW
jgi:hypothetical protein